VHLAVTGMLDELPDMVVSGINHGANMGDDTIYSGTVAAATEGFLLGVPAIAISLVAKGASDFSGAAQVPGNWWSASSATRSVPTLLNVNVPDLPFDQIKGIQVTRLGKRHKAEPTIKSVTPRNETVYWVGAAGAAQDAGEGTDFHAVANGYASVTPADRSDPPGPDRHRPGLARQMSSEVLRAALQTAQRARARMIERLREQGARRAGAGSHDGGAASALRGGGPGLPCLRGHGAAPGPAADHLPALRGGADDRDPAGRRELGKTLEVGTGCGYQAAVLSHVATEVYSVERLRPLLDRARNNLRHLRLPNVRLKHADGSLGLREAAPYDTIIVAAAAPKVPQALVDQLSEGGRLILPVGAAEQSLVLIERTVRGIRETRLSAVRFVPLLPGIE
jgi:hypothetical protein